MLPTITVFSNSPDRGRGLARDMPVRWAFEEVGQAYAVRPVSFADLKEAPHRALQPFGQIPSCEFDGLALFESGAIVLHIAQGHAGLLPAGARARARAISWMFAALSTVEPVIMELERTSFQERGKAWLAERMPLVEASIHGRLRDLSNHLGARDWLDGPFSAGDLLMAQVLRRLSGTTLLAQWPNLSAYVARAESRPAFQRAFAAQQAEFLKQAPGSGR